MKIVKTVFLNNGDKVELTPTTLAIVSSRDVVAPSGDALVALDIAEAKELISWLYSEIGGQETGAVKPSKPDMGKQYIPKNEKPLPSPEELASRSAGGAEAAQALRVGDAFKGQGAMDGRGQYKMEAIDLGVASRSIIVEPTTKRG